MNIYFQTENKLAILAFPCNQFGAQEPGTNSDIKKFAEGFGVQFDKNGGKCGVCGDNYADVQVGNIHCYKAGLKSWP